MSNTDSMWVVIHMAHSERRAEAARELLATEGFLVRLRPIAHSLLAGDHCVEILVLSSEAKEARDLLSERIF